MDRSEKNENENDGEIEQDDEVKKYKEINVQLSKTLAKLKKKLAKVKTENKLCTVEHKKKLKEICELEKLLANSKQMHENHITNLKAKIQFAITKKNDFEADKIKNDKLSAEFLTKLSINNDREKSDSKSKSTANVPVSTLDGRSILSDNETQTNMAASSRPKRNIEPQSYVEPKLNKKLRRVRI